MNVDKFKDMDNINKIKEIFTLELLKFVPLKPIDVRGRF